MRLSIKAIGTMAIIGSDFGKQTKQNKASNHDAQVDIEECRKELTIYLDVLKNGLAPQ